MAGNEAMLGPDKLSSKMGMELLAMRDEGYEIDVRMREVAPTRIEVEVLMDEETSGALFERLRKDPELCGHCLKPIEDEWVACPYCGEKVEVPHD